jgi:hypothetical protein
MLRRLAEDASHRSAVISAIFNGYFMGYYVPGKRRYLERDQ